jgi:acetylornithine deacetylase
MLECFRQLIAIPSVSCIDPRLDQSNHGVVELLAGWLEDLGFNVEMMPVAEQPAKYNLIARRGSGPGGLVLAGHTDTVPYDETRWDQDPFALTEKDSRLYGLGTSDMKCFFPLVLEAIQNIDLGKLREPLCILATADEESTMSGARALAASGRKLGRHALIGEPTGLRPVHQHKGIIIEAIKLTGRAAHSSNPALGISALEGMNAVINALTAWRSELQQAYNNERFHVPVPTLNFGSIHGGDNPNRICAECVMNIDLRLLPGMALPEFRAGLYDVVQRAVAGSGLKVEMHENFEGVPAMHTDKDARIVRCAEELSGHSAGAVDFVTEGPCLNALGMQTVVLGPGNIEQAHQANEYLAMDRIRPMVEIITGMVHHFCVNDVGPVSTGQIEEI